MNGFKFLSPDGATEYNGERTIYPLPGPGEKWGSELIHPESADPDGRDCGPGRYHVMKNLSNPYGPRNWWPWYVRSTGTIVGHSREKFGTTALRLRRISPAVWHRIIRLGWCSGADLRGANLRGANLMYANLSDANLMYANLSDANLSYANLRGANLMYANLSDANLMYANLSDADLRGANLRGANLSYADLSDAIQ